MTDPLLRWVAEELLGWRVIPDSSSWLDQTAQAAQLWQLESWHGIGLVVEEMERRGFPEWSLSRDNSGYAQGISGHWARFYGPEGDQVGEAYGAQPWLAVYTAARRAVEGG